ncbi:MAG: response regulator [Longimicrobiales bacterium]|nr:response regulator [Longimicrobiales bacterium]
MNAAAETAPVLVIEDDEQNRYLVVYLLERHGYRVRAASTAAEGIRLAEEELPSMILLDIQLPEVDGYAAVRALRAIDAFRDLPVVAITAHALPADRARALEAGCTAWLRKPIEPDSFLDTLRELGLGPPPEDGR